MTTNRTDFNESFLFEMPILTPTNRAYDIVVNDINDFIKAGGKPVSLGNNLYKMGNDTIFYWYQDGDTITLATELDNKRYAYADLFTGKNPNYKGKPPFLHNLYDAILNDTGRSIVLRSDSQLSDSGYNAWKKLFKLGYNVSVYNVNKPGQTFERFEKIEDMENFIDTSTDFKQYRFVLSENINKSENILEIVAAFGTRRGREISGMFLED